MLCMLWYAQRSAAAGPHLRHQHLQRHTKSRPRHLKRILFVAAKPRSHLLLCIPNRTIFYPMHHGNKDPMHGCQSRTRCPVVPMMTNRILLVSVSRNLHASMPHKGKDGVLLLLVQLFLVYQASGKKTETHICSSFRSALSFQLQELWIGST
jgi:hypothetical protein